MPHLPLPGRFGSTVPACVLMLALAWACLRPGPATAQRSLPSPPDILADTSYGTVDLDLDLVELDGSSTNLSVFEGQVLFINFWATWCAPCRAEMPSIEALSNRLASAPVEVLMISVDDDVEEVRRFVADHGIEGRIYIRDWQAGESPFRRAVIPTTYVISKNREIRYRHSGAVDWNSEAFAAYLIRLAHRID